MNIHWIGIALSVTLGNTALAQGAPQAPMDPAHPTAKDVPSGPTSGSALKGRRSTAGRSGPSGDLPGQTPRGFSEAERAAWRRGLAQPDLDHRFGAYLELVERAASDPLVEELLLAWAHDDSDVELAWSARLGLREARSMRVRNRRGARRYSDLMTGLSVHVAEVPQGIMVAKPRGVLPGDGSGRSGSRILRLQTGPTGVRLEVRDTSEEGGRAEVIEAPDLAQLLEQHPELARDLASVRLVPEPGAGEADALVGDLSAQMEFSFDALWSGDAGLLRTDILGIRMRELASDVGSAGDQAPPVGLFVEGVLHDTIAEVIALKRGDLLLELNSVALECGDDLSRIIKGREASGTITVTVERDGALHTLTWKPTISGDRAGVPVEPAPPIERSEPTPPATDGE